MNFGEINCEVVRRKIGCVRLPLSIGGMKSISGAGRS
jgi:predicted nuclease with RNAse H fold